MRTLFITLHLFYTSFTLQVLSQTTLSEWFIKSSSPHLSILSKNDRLDLIDYYDSEQNASVENLYKGSTVLTYKDNTRMSLQLTSVSSYDLYTLHTDSVDTIRMEILTIEKPIPNFQISLYKNEESSNNLNFDLSPLYKQYESTFSTLNQKHDLIQSGVSANFDQATKKLTINLISANTFQAENKTDTLSLIYLWNEEEKAFLKN
ncbi:MAG: DUF3256 family protein [Bacteroidaceae bacterium]|nr:DUF3256 family protein [Bacteroidaceae bacterium]